MAAGYRPANSRDAAPRNTHRGPWPSADVAAFAFRCKALGGSEDATLHYLGVAEAHRVRSLARFTRNIPDADLVTFLRHAQQQVEVMPATKRGDLIRLRSVSRWPWRTSTSQPVSGLGGDGRG